MSMEKMEVMFRYSRVLTQVLRRDRCVLYREHQVQVSQHFLTV